MGVLVEGICACYCNVCPDIQPALGLGLVSSLNSFPVLPLRPCCVLQAAEMAGNFTSCGASE